MPSDAQKKTPLDMIDALIGAPAARGQKPKGRSVLMAHALAQRENRMAAEKRAAASRLAVPENTPTAGKQPQPGPAATARPAPGKPAPGRPAPGKPAPERPGLDAMIVKALGASARGHVRNGSFDRQAALADLIARTQSRLGTAGALQPVAAPAGDGRRDGDRESAIAAAMRTHRERQEVFDELSLRQRATLRATAEAIVDRRRS